MSSTEAVSSLDTRMPATKRSTTSGSPSILSRP
ncbi:Hypothetical protein PFCIRM119_00345 [Propionibacterium freudenreichii]|uniref:Uncharacterized protein n=1 Tax=Propionibacterium freudenreichii subsp. shermanii (strain ATCC 9614 / DSM 4902 / CIP 103027 / NCIMB 8099 / CIRM-BIA1) TaxID=754252 RepID=D7GHT3_PROFC|nr:Hypothetical protein PFREUD_01370 [Propionibacterium freudenreichii subsp. shermanii CIRM-BIA1]CDP49622.1 Hypothetical protein PFCIRM129_01190 [Propionibacterium freudenreichii subsp. freudenreichii]CEG86479.1 Hypothetical protein PFCIRM118_10755 [Propionibacterium freudenreichii]CEG90095.1 Hypothetical protein PFCIRM119_00345 [Propionibacterium freudenreichii]CEG91011.1 Hypothetical protein PFCIRM121_06825 [Propionibacterium freudenreichii]